MRLDDWAQAVDDLSAARQALGRIVHEDGYEIRTFLRLAYEVVHTGLELDAWDGVDEVVVEVRDGRANYRLVLPTTGGLEEFVDDLEKGDDIFAGDGVGRVRRLLERWRTTGAWFAKGEFLGQCADFLGWLESERAAEVGVEQPDAREQLWRLGYAIGELESL